MGSEEKGNPVQFWCQEILSYLEKNQGKTPTLDSVAASGTTEILRVSQSGAIENRGKLLLEMDIVSTLIRVELQDSRFASQIQDYIDALSRPEGLK